MEARRGSSSLPLVTPAEVMENLPALDLLWRTCFRWKLRPRQVTGDTTYGTTEIIVAIEDAGIRAYVPLPDFGHRTRFFGRDQFTYDADARYLPLPRWSGACVSASTRTPSARGSTKPRPPPATAARSSPQCTSSAKGRQVKRSFDEAYLDRVRGYHDTESYEKAMRKRQVWVEPLFAEAKDWHGLRRFRLRGLEKVNGEALLIAAGQNLKRLLGWRGWGRRPFPSGSAGVVLPALPSPRILAP